MRSKESAPELWRLWEKGGPFIGENGASNGYVTVEPNYWLRPSRVPPEAAQSEAGLYGRVPIRTFQREANDQVEWVVPNVKSIQMERSIDSDAATCTITMFNQKMTGAAITSSLEGYIQDEFGQPGYYSPDRGDRKLVQNRRKGSQPTKWARWQQNENEWHDVLGPNALLRTFQGYGGRGKSLEDALADGNVIQTGTWLVDRVSTGTDGLLTLECRDMTKLLLDQLIYPPLVPTWVYPLEYARWRWEKVKVRVRVADAVRNVRRRCVYRDSSEDRWYPSKVVAGRGAPIHGHYPADSIDRKGDTFWLSVGNSHPSKAFCTNWIEYEINEEIDAFFLEPWGGPYTCYVSLYIQGEGWIGDNTVPYDHTPLIGHQPHVVDTGADIPYMKKVEVGTSAPAGSGAAWASIIQLGKKYKPKYMRLSFRNHKYTQWGIWHYRVGIREFYPVLTYREAQYEDQDKIVKLQGNYMDYVDIIKELLLWSGWWLYPTSGYVRQDSMPEVYGNLESTGAWNEEPLPREMFDKRPVMEAINELSAIVGYQFWIDEEGAAHWEAPNWYKAGNFDIRSGEYMSFLPEINEMHNLMSYTATQSDQAARSQVIVSTMDPMEFVPGTIVTKYKPKTADMLKGMIKPAMWIQGNFSNKQESKVMAELLALRAFFAQRQGSISCVANPCISPNDQVRIVERVSSESYIHYVRSVETMQNFETGEYTANMSTHWLGDKDDWAIVPPTSDADQRRWYVVQPGDTWATIIANLYARYKIRWTENWLKWVNKDLLEDTNGALLTGMVLAVS